MSDNKNPIVTLDITNYGKIEIELYPDIAPNTVNSFISLVKSGFYDGIIFHRVVTDFMIQGGDPTGTGMGGPGYHIKGEFSANGFKNDLHHAPGVISMARAMDKDSAGSQFFIMHGDAPFLDGQYAGFGKVVNGMAVVDAIANCDVDNPFSQSPRPLEPVVIAKAIVDTKGVEYPEPEKV
ncbi:MAG: peptidylprolyl isomerase [Ruminococcaceae bacterium]|nr:peptidylprolyl isomerase [Oscillospiraceae bacterium]